MSKGPYRGELLPYIEPAVEHLHTLGRSLYTEKILVGDGYAGKTDLILAVWSRQRDLGGLQDDEEGPRQGFLA